MRRLFLWAARNAWLQQHLPALPFMRRAVRRFMPGETLASALDAAAPLQAAGIAGQEAQLRTPGSRQPPRRGRRRSRQTRSLPAAGCTITTWKAEHRPATG